MVQQRRINVYESANTFYALWVFRDIKIWRAELFVRMYPLKICLGLDCDDVIINRKHDFCSIECANTWRRYDKETRYISR